MKPLSGIKILDLTRVLAGPLATQILADLGAEVLKIERPGQGDETRAWGPPYYDAAQGLSAYFLTANRGKETRALDFNTPEHVKEIKNLALNSDIVVENFKVGGLAKYGLDAQTLRAENPGLIYLSLTGFGQTGPRAGEAGYDLLLQGLSGLMSITGTPQAPTKVGVAVIDIMTGLYGVIAILAALRKRDQDQGGTCIDLALFDVAVAGLANQAMNYLVSGQVPPRLGNAHPNIAPYEVYAASDGHLILAVGNDGQFANFCQVAGLDLHQQDRFATNAARVQNRDALNAILQPLLLTQGRQAWLDLLQPRKVPCGPIQSIDEVFADPQAQARELIHEVEGVPGIASPLMFDGVRLMSKTPPPAKKG